jgi:hypothetical protein
MAICSYDSPACCCQPAIAGGVIYADLLGELSTHLAGQALFTQSSPVLEPVLQTFPFPSTLGEVTLHPLSQASVFIYSSHGKWAFSPLLWSFPPTPLLQAFPLLIAGRVLLPSPAGLVYLQFCEGFPSPPLVLRVPHPLCYMSFFLLLLLIIQFLFFPLGGGWSVQGAMLIWPRVVCGSTAYRLAHLVVRVFPSRLDTGIWRQRGSPPGFSL